MWLPWMAPPKPLNWDLLTVLKRGRILMFVILHIVLIVVLCLTSYNCSHSEYYITMVKWVGPESLSVRWVNRAQNMSILSLCSVVMGICASVRTTLWRDLQARAPCTVCLLTCLFLIFQKNVMTSEKWLDRQVSVPIIVLCSQPCCQTFV